MTHMHHHGHGHSHGADLGDWEEPVGVGIRQVLMVAVIVLAVATLAGLALWWPRGEPQLDRGAVDFGDRVQATVTSAETAPCSYDPAEECRTVEFRVTSGSSAGDTGTIEQSAETQTPAARLDEGDGIVVSDGGPGAGEGRFQFADVQRSSGLLILAALFAVAVVALGRRRGLLALGGIVLTVGVLLVFVFPALLRGTSPVGVALTGACVIAFGTFYLAHGINERTSVALLGTLTSLLLTATLASAFTGIAHLSGLASEESLTLLAFAPELDFQGLLLAAVVIGALGVLDDVTITQVASVWELRRTDPDLSARQLYAAGIRIGRDHIASTVNTLVLAYTAAALPLLLLFTQSGLSLFEVLTSETVAVEVVQTLVGSIGLIASVPLTTALACWVVTRSDARSDDAPVPPPSPRPRNRGGRKPDLELDPEGPATRRHETVVPAWEPSAPGSPAARTPAPPGSPGSPGSPGGWPRPDAGSPDVWPPQAPAAPGSWPPGSTDPSESWAAQDPTPSGAWPHHAAPAPATRAAPDPTAPGSPPRRAPRTAETWTWPDPATGSPPRHASRPSETWAPQDRGPADDGAWTGRTPAAPPGAGTGGAGRPQTGPHPRLRRPPDTWEPGPPDGQPVPGQRQPPMRWPDVRPDASPGSWEEPDEPGRRWPTRRPPPRPPDEPPPDEPW